MTHRPAMLGLCLLAASSLGGCHIFNGFLPKHFGYITDCDHYDGCFRDACEDCVDNCLRRCWGNIDDTATNFGCPNGDVYYGGAYCRYDEDEDRGGANP
jgi:hypothetical protein